MKVGTVISGRYRLERMLGEGGMGQVWSARHVHLDSMVAVKLLAPSAVSNEVLRARFEREARALGQLRSPHVVQVFDYGIDEDGPFMVMELLEGEDLAFLRQERKYWTLSEVAQIVVQAGRGLSAAHKAGVIHRDVKPGNLFLAEIEGQTVLKVLDFGIAKPMEDNATEITKTNVGIGSPSYMSPEQTSTLHVDARTDVWSLAVVAFVLLTGELPFQAESPFMVGQKVLRGQRPRPTQLVEGLPKAIDAFFDRALAVSRDERFSTPNEMAEALTSLARLHPDAVASDPDVVMTARFHGVQEARKAALNAGREQAQLGRTIKLSTEEIGPAMARVSAAIDQQRAAIAAAAGQPQVPQFMEDSSSGESALTARRVVSAPPPSGPPSSGVLLQTVAMQRTSAGLVPITRQPTPSQPHLAPQHIDPNFFATKSDPVFFVSKSAVTEMRPRPTMQQRNLIIAAVVASVVVSLGLLIGAWWFVSSSSSSSATPSGAPTTKPSASATGRR